MTPSKMIGTFIAYLVMAGIGIAAIGGLALLIKWVISIF